MKSCVLRLILVVVLMASCGRHELERHVDVPVVLSSEVISMELHGKATLQVSGASGFTVSVNSDIVRFSVSGNTITLYAVAEGNAILTVRAEDRRSAVCEVHVSPRTSLPPLTDAELDDSTFRFESKQLTLRYGKPGIMYIYDNNRSELSFVVLDNVMQMVTLCLSEQILYVGGNKIPLSMVKRTATPSAVYYQLVAESDGEVMLCVCDV